MTIKIEIGGALRSRRYVFKDTEGCAMSVALAMKFLADYYPEAVRRDHQLHEEGIQPPKGFAGFQVPPYEDEEEPEEWPAAYDDHPDPEPDESYEDEEGEDAYEDEPEPSPPPPKPRRRQEGRGSSRKRGPAKQARPGRERGPRRSSAGKKSGRRPRRQRDGGDRDDGGDAGESARRAELRMMENRMAQVDASALEDEAAELIASQPSEVQDLLRTLDAEDEIGEQFVEWES